MTTMLPALPRTFGRLSDVFASSLGAITGADNRLSFRRSKQVCAILVDGLGTQNLKSAAGHAPFLNAAFAAAGSAISCAFPATTATSISSFATGLSAGQHGIVGYQLFDRQSGVSANMLSGWNSTLKPGDWKIAETISEKALASGVATYFVGPAEYEGSGFTQLTMPVATYVAAKSISDRVDRALDLLSGKQEAVVYLYVPELDQAAHSQGTSSRLWLERVEELDSQVRRLASKLPKTVGVALTADHGVIDVDHSRHIYLDELEFDWSATLAVAGDPRVPYLYLADQTPGSVEENRTRLQGQLGRSAAVLTAAELVKAGLFGEMLPTAQARLPELAIVSLDTVAIYHRGFAKPQSMKMIGQHGSVSSAELSIPLVRLGAFT